MPLLRLIKLLIFPILLLTAATTQASPYQLNGKRLSNPSVSAQGPLDWIVNHPATIRYSLDLQDVQQHLLHITIDFPAVPTGVFSVKMPTASPGRYAEHNFAKNVYDVSATSENGMPLLVSKSSINQWDITGHQGRVILRYTLFANDGDGTYAGIDIRKLHLNMPAVFLYGEGLNDRPVLLQLPTNQMPSWTVATQLVDLGLRRYGAPNYYYFFDSPTLVGNIDLRRWTVNSNGRIDTIEVAMMHQGSPEEVDRYQEMVRRVVAEQQRVYGELPAFDYGRYTFLCSYNPYIGGDGMEHRNSTVCSAPVGLADYAEQLIGTVSHEFFHAWNVERIRPAMLEPFDFDHANMSDELWFAEGFTSYYDDLTLVRTGIMSLEDYCDDLVGDLNYVIHQPGRRHRNPIEMSQMAPFVDAATANDEDNFHNTFTSYYPYGAILGLTLDLELRQRGQNLDDYMRWVWQRYGKTEIPYHIQDLETTLGDYCGDPNWADEWFNQYVYQSALPDFPVLLRQFGLRLTVERPDSAAFYGLNLSEVAEGMEVLSNVLENSVLYGSGLDRGSIITAINGQSITNRTAWEQVVAGLQIGQAYTIHFLQLGLEQRGQFVAQASPKLVLAPLVNADPYEIEQRKSWLGQ
ncbi:MAG: M61 family peptidase [Bacteroidota bacterium]